MTSRLRELIQQLGEAIHESVIESEQIAGVVQGHQEIWIRRAAHARSYDRLE